MVSTMKDVWRILRQLQAGPACCVAVLSLAASGCGSDPEQPRSSVQVDTKKNDAAEAAKPKPPESPDTTNEAPAGGAGKEAPKTDPEAKSKAPASGSDKPGSSDPSANTAKPYACGDAAKGSADVLLHGMNVGDQHWKGVVEVSGDVRVGGGTIRIDPATVFVMQDGASLTFSDQFNLDEADAGAAQATVLKAEGRADAPIRFCGANPKPGAWLGVEITLDTEGSSLQHWLIEGAGSMGGAALTLDAPARIEHVQVVNALWNGVSASLIGADSQALRVEGAGNYPVVLTAPPAVTNFPKNSLLQNNKRQFVAVTLSEMSEPATLRFHKLDIPYLQTRDLVLTRGGQCEFEAGVDYRFAAGVKFDIGTFGGPAELSVAGTQSAPVSFRGEQSKRGFWGGFIVNPAVKASSTIAHASFSHAGAGDAYALSLNSGIRLENVTLTENARGLQLHVAMQKGSKQLVVKDNDGPAVSVPVEAMFDLPAEITLQGNGRNMIDVAVRRQGPAVTGTVRNIGVPYHMQATVFSQDKDDITLEPGVEWVFAPGARLELGALNAKSTFRATGSEAKPIVMRGEQPGRGTWAGILVDEMVSDQTAFEHVQFRGAGLQLLRPTKVADCRFEDSTAFGIKKLSSDKTDYSANNEFSGNQSGAVGTF